MEALTEVLRATSVRALASDPGDVNEEPAITERGPDVYVDLGPMASGDSIPEQLTRSHTGCCSED